MTASLGNTSQGTPFATGVDAFVYPQYIGYSNRPPSTNDIQNPGTRWLDNSVSPPVQYYTTGAGRWYVQLNTSVVTVAAGSSPRTANARSGQVTFSGVSIIGGGTESFVINNNQVSSSTVILYSLAGSTTGSALTIKSVTNASGSSTIVVQNGMGLPTSVANITFTFIVIN